MKASLIRKATSEDVKDLASLSSSLIKSKWDEETFSREINENEFSNIYLYILDDKIIGFIDYWITFDSSTICELGTHKNYQRKGIASSLLNFMVEDLKKNEVIWSTLEVRKSNIPAINLYKKNGYKEECIKEKYYEDGEDAVYMVKGII